MTKKKIPDLTDINYYPTPKKLVLRMIELAEVKPEHYCLEPSAGKGAIVKRLLGLGCRVACVEKEWKYAHHLMRKQYYSSLQCKDFLHCDQRPQHDRVLMNPPLAQQQDVAHVMHALGFLVAGGILISVMGSGIRFRDDAETKKLRKIIKRRGGRIKDLPPGTFKELPPSVGTCLVIIRMEDVEG